MSQGFYVWGLIFVAAVAANLPFMGQRLFGIWPLAGGTPKNLAWRLLELVVAYFAVGILGLALEKRAGQLAPQGWEFYAITAALFLTLAFPGFVYRYLMRHADAS